MHSFQRMLKTYTNSYTIFIVYVNNMMNGKLLESEMLIASIYQYPRTIFRFPGSSQRI